MIRLSKDTATSEQHLAEIEKEYEEKHADPENLKKLDDLRVQISGMIGKNNLNYLREYTDRLVAQFNKDCDWFYRKGLEEGCHLMPQPE